MIVSGWILAHLGNIELSEGKEKDREMGQQAQRLDNERRDT